MAGKAKRVTAKQLGHGKHGLMSIHEDKVPGVMAIPFKLDDNDIELDGDKSCGHNSGGDGKLKRDGTKLDLPHVHYYTRVQHFSLHRKPDYNEKAYRELKPGSSKMSISVDPCPRSQTSKLNLRKFDAAENLQRNTKKKLGLYLTNKTVSFRIRNQSTSISLPVGSNRKPKTQNGDRTKETSDQGPSRELLTAYNWNNFTGIFSDHVLSAITKSWRKTVKPFTQEDIGTVLRELNITMKQFQSLSVVTGMEHSVEIGYLHGVSCRAIMPDLLKMSAFTAWQEGSSPKSIYYLSEAQNFFTRREVMEKHSAYFVRKSYERSRDKYSATSPLEDKKDELFRIQSEALRSFAGSRQTFENNLAKLNPEWNVIQLTRLFHHKNRFGASQNNGSDAFAIFISAFINVDGTRCPFVTYLPPPLCDAGVSKHNIVESLRTLMTKNRKLNEHYKGSRNKYWSLRSQQNVELKTLLDSVEENWIYPWEFLFYGNIMDKDIVTYIRTSLKPIQKILLMNFTPSLQGVLYKLVENYNLLKSGLQNNLQRFIEWITGASAQTSSEIASLITQYGSALNLQSYPRSPTILVLDQELDLIPWESMDCLKTTPVTRVPSISLIHSLTYLRTLKKEKYGETIDSRSCGYVLNPDGSLKGVEERLAGYFGAVVSWSGVTGRKPSLADFENYFQKKDLYLYCGHGNGTAYFSESRIQKVSCRAIPLLMGCGSVRYKHHGPRSLSTSIVTSLFSATAVCCVGFLYEVTDLECDRVTLELLEHWAPGAKGKLPAIISFDPNAKRNRERCLANAVRIARGGATQFLTSAGLVCYGIPVLTQDN